MTKDDIIRTKYFNARWKLSNLEKQLHTLDSKNPNHEDKIRFLKERIVTQRELVDALKDEYDKWYERNITPKFQREPTKPNTFTFDNHPWYKRGTPGTPKSRGGLNRKFVPDSNRNQTR